LTRLLLVLLAATLFTPASFAQKVPDTLAKIKAAGSITVAFSGDSLPFSYVESNNQPGGYSIDLCKRVIAAIGRAVGVPDLKVNWVVDTVPNRIAMITIGKADLECANTTASQTRMKEVDFSNLIFVDGGGFLVRSDSTIMGFPDFASKSIAVTAGTTTEQRLIDMLKDRAISAKVVSVRTASKALHCWNRAQSPGSPATRSAYRARRAGQGPQDVRTAVAGPLVRALCVHGSPQRFRVSTRSEQGIDPDLHFGRHRRDLPEVAW
jgi:ABC-type amino acid transport substrate-binding protein